MDGLEPPIHLDLKSSKASKDYILSESDNFNSEDLFHHTEILLQDKILQGNGVFVRIKFLLLETKTVIDGMMKFSETSICFETM